VTGLLTSRPNGLGRLARAFQPARLAGFVYLGLCPRLQ
jgi:hypothetical protein